MWWLAGRKCHTAAGLGPQRRRGTGQQQQGPDILVGSQLHEVLGDLDRRGHLVPPDDVMGADSQVGVSGVVCVCLNMH